MKTARQIAADALFRDAAKRMVESEYAEAEAFARLCSIPDGATSAQIDEWIAEANLAQANRTQSQLHYANCKRELALAYQDPQQ